MIRAGIVGAAGYTGGELIQILSNHPQVTLSFCQSNSQAGKEVSLVHTGVHELDLKFTGKVSEEVDVLFLCMGHGRSKDFLSSRKLPPSIKLVDLSQDFRLMDDHGFIYGLPEAFRQQIRTAKYLANPGCFATSIQLGLLPMAQLNKIRADVHVHGITGSTGAGQSPSTTSHFSWRNNNVSIYKAFNHQHLDEINQTLKSLDPGFTKKICFVPIRGNFTRGILASIYFESDLKESEVVEIYQSYYENHPFVKVIDQSPDIKMVVNTNYCLLQIRVHEGMIHIISVIDNLTKGASGQATQNMNLMFGLEETTGLKLKSSAF
ncbi:MAG: N-acetyl-gamma-glutamyl-phosphate reductase [Saprospiraceae bacterium]|nr:N-acetyl-gamma-glutamyl-phosphate reductase [Saprospiraceae bacterium]